MPVIKRRLIHDERTPKGFEIQGIQKSKELAGHVVEDIVLQTIKPDWDRGHHYHNNKTEWFLAVDGSATLTWFDIDGNKEEHSDLKEADFSNPTLFEIEPRTCHTVTNKSGKGFLMLALSTKDFDPKNPDNIGC